MYSLEDAQRATVAPGVVGLDGHPPVEPSPGTTPEGEGREAARGERVQGVEGHDTEARTAEKSETTNEASSRRPAPKLDLTTLHRHTRG